MGDGVNTFGIWSIVTRVGGTLVGTLTRARKVFEECVGNGQRHMGWCPFGYPGPFKSGRETRTQKWLRLGTKGLDPLGVKTVVDHCSVSDRIRSSLYGLE